MRNFFIFSKSVVLESRWSRLAVVGLLVMIVQCVHIVICAGVTVWYIQENISVLSVQCLVIQLSAARVTMSNGRNVGVPLASG